MSKNIEVIQVFPFFSGEYCPYWCKMTAWLCNFGTDQVSHWWLLAILFLHLHLHLGHGFGHSQGQLRLRLQLLLSTQEVHVLQRLRVILGGVPVWVGWTLLGLQGGSGVFFGGVGWIEDKLWQGGIQFEGESEREKKIVKVRERSKNGGRKGGEIRKTRSKD